MKRNNLLAVFDFETWSLSIDTCEIVEVACLMLDPKTLKVVPGSEFASRMRPLDLNNYEQGAIGANSITPEEAAKAPSRAAVWPRFCAHVRKYNFGKSLATAPIAAGKNIRRFDLPIVERLCAAHGELDNKKRPNLFCHRTVIDLEDDLYRWFNHLDEVQSLSMDSLREYFGISKEGAHSALVDVRQTADVIARFFLLYREMSKRVSFKGAFSK